MVLIFDVKMQLRDIDAIFNAIGNNLVISDVIVAVKTYSKVMVKIFDIFLVSL